MANIFGVGVSGLQICVLKTESTAKGTECTYGPKLEVTATNSIQFSPTTTTSSADGDNKQVASITLAVAGTLTWTGWGVPDATYATVFGHTAGTDSEYDESFADVAPYVGVGYIRKFMNQDGDVTYKAYWYRKCQGVPGDEEQNTQGTNLELSSTEVEFNVSEPGYNPYRTTKSFSTEDAATAWLAAFAGT